MNGTSYTFENDTYLPLRTDFNLTHPRELTDLWSVGLSGAQFLPNGNTLILSGRFGYAFELTPDDEIVWEYITPTRGTERATQGDELFMNDNSTFRLDRYPLDFAAFEGRDLTPMGWLELEPNETFCDLLVSTGDVLKAKQLSVYPNPASSVLTLAWEETSTGEVNLTNLMGQSIYRGQVLPKGELRIDVSGIAAGVYLLRVDGVRTAKVVVQR